MRLFLLFGFSECAAPIDTGAPSEPPAVGVACGDVATLPEGMFAISAIVVGTVETAPEVYGVYAAPVAWEQVDQEVYVWCPEEDQIEASIHSAVVYYAPTL